MISLLNPGVDDGVFSYNRVVELLLAYYEKRGCRNKSQQPF